MPRQPIPRFSDEHVAAEARKQPFGDAEKVPTTSLTEMEVEGVQISSRYRKADEFEVMQAMVLGVRPQLREHVQAVFCDSKACADYTVTTKRCSQMVAQELLGDMSAVCRYLRGGYNGLSVQGNEGAAVYLDPEWYEDLAS